MPGGHGFDKRGIFKAAPMYDPIREAGYAQTADTRTGHWVGDVFNQIGGAIGMGRQGAARQREEQAYYKKQQEDAAKYAAERQAWAAELGISGGELQSLARMSPEGADSYLGARQRELDRQKKDAEAAQMEAQQAEMAARDQRIAGGREARGRVMDKRRQAEFYGGQLPGMPRDQLETAINAGQQGFLDDQVKAANAPPPASAASAPSNDFERWQADPEAFAAFQKAKGGGAPPKLTEQQSKSARVVREGERNLAILAETGQRGKPLFEAMANPQQALTDKVLPGSYGNSPDYRQGQTALRNIIEAVLRQATGAAAPESEVRDYMTRLSPRPGDDPGTVRQKWDQLSSMIRDNAALAGPAYGQLFGGEPTIPDPYGAQQQSASASLFSPDNPFAQ